MRLLVAAAGAALLAGLAGCGGTAQANETACAEALQDVLRGDAPMAKPSECAGLTDERMGELSFHGSPQAADAAAEDGEPAAATTGDAACRQDLEAQLAGVTASDSYSVSRRNSACDTVSDTEMKRMAAVIIYGATR